MEPTLSLRTARIALLRAIPLAVLGAAVLGWPGAVVGLVAAPVAIVEVWGRRQERSVKTAVEVAALAGCVAFVLLMLGLLQGIYTAALIGERAGHAASLQFVFEAWQGLAEPSVGQVHWYAALPWVMSWLWVHSAAGPLVTVGGFAGIYALNAGLATLPRTTPERTSAGCGAVVGGIVVALVAAFAFDPGGPLPEYQFTSAQGLDEVMEMIGSLALFAAAIPVATALVDRRFPVDAPESADEDAVVSPADALEEPRSRAWLWATVVACVAGSTVAFGVLPRRVAGDPVARAAAKLESSAPADRQRGLGELWELGRRSRPHLPAVIERLGDADPAVRTEAAEFLGQGKATPAFAKPLHRRHAEIVPKLQALLADPSPAVREQVIWSLGQYSDPSSTPLLRRVSERDPSKKVRGMARLILGR